MSSCSNSLRDGLAIARDRGYGIYHIDLLLKRARLHLLCGEPQAALTATTNGEYNYATQRIVLKTQESQMSLTLTLDDNLAGRLQEQARVRNLSVEHWALFILTNASEFPDRPETWTELNERRLSLIRKRFSRGLNAAEKKSLATLQDHAAKVFEPADRQRLEHVKSLSRQRGRRG